MTEQPSRSDRLFERLDTQLKKLPTAAERRRLLLNLIDGWEGRYRAWIRTDGESEWTAPGAEPISSFDFRETIDGLAARVRSVEA